MSQPTAPPDTIGPYTLDSLLGTGGMGEVYKAFDPRLDRWVAVKHIKAEFALKAGYRQRLEREAKTIASLDHPSIVHIYDVLQDDEGGEWIVMELVDGPTVYDMVEFGPLDLGTTLTIALDVIHGLGVAHDQGVLHRDLKSENVMVSRKGVAKILDFGLSKRLEQVDEVTLSMEGKVIGTCRVMAPEQADGQDLDGRADLFSFGILLYEMVTARSPFRASTPMASMLKAFGEAHAPVHSYNPDVPQELSDLIDWLLSKNRNHRPENAQVVATELAEIAADVTDDPAELAERIRMGSRSWHGSGAHALPDPSSEEMEEDPLDDTVPGGPSKPYDESSRATHSNRRTASLSRAAASRAVEQTMERSRLDLDRRTAGTTSQSRWSSMFSTAFGLGLSPSRRALAWTAWLMAILTGWWGVASMTRPMIPEEPDDARIVVLPFANHGPREMAYFAAGLTSEIIRELTRRRGLEVVSYRTSSHYGSEERSLQDLQEELDVSHVLLGEVTSDLNLPSDGRIRVGLQLIRVTDGTVLLSRSFDRMVRDTLRVQREIADDVSLELGAQVFADSRADLSTEPRALEAFFHGLELVYGSGYRYETLPDAEQFFEEAVRIDPDFVRGWTELAKIRSLRIFNGLADPGAKAEAEAALKRAEELESGSPSVVLARGYFKYHVQGDLTGAAKEFERAAALSPDDPEVRFAQGLVLRRLGLLGDAIAALESAFDLDRANSNLAWFIAETERGRRDYRNAERWFANSMRKSIGLNMALTERIENSVALNGCGQLGQPPRCKTESARRLLHELGAEEDPISWSARVHLALLDLAAGGPDSEFLRVFDSVDEENLEDNQRYLVFWRKALVLREMGRTDEAADLVDRYRRELEQKVNSEYWLHYAALSMSLALQGRSEDADLAMERAFRSAGADRFSGPRLLKWSAIVSLQLSRPDQALDRIEQASQIDYQKSLASYELQADPMWAPLRESGRLQSAWEEIRRRETRD